MNKVKKIIHFFFADLDYKLILIVVALSIIGIVFSYSSQILIRGEKINLYFKFVKQIIYFFLGFFIMLGVARINYVKLAEHSLVLIIFCIGLLIFTLIGGVVVNNSKRWISILGIANIQPSEFVKLVIIVFTANYLTKIRRQFITKKYLLLIFVFNLIPLGLVFVQPDLGTAAISFFIILVMTTFSIIQKKYLLAIFGFMGVTIMSVFLFIYFSINESSELLINGVFSNKTLLFWGLMLLLFLAILLIVANFIFWRNLNIYYTTIALLLVVAGIFTGLVIDEFFLKSYQKERLLVFLDPYSFRWSLGYNIIQSKITIGSGGFLGKGLFNGAQSQLGFLPSRSTDFIFSVIGEELGLWGASLVILLFFLLIWRLFSLISKVKDYLGVLIIIGVTTFFAVQSVVNIGMTMSLFPITGLPLPFISAGGSTLLSSLMAIGLVLSVYRKRNINNI